MTAMGLPSVNPAAVNWLPDTASCSSWPAPWKSASKTTLPRVSTSNVVRPTARVLPTPFPLTALILTRSNKHWRTFQVRLSFVSSSRPGLSRQPTRSTFKYHSLLLQLADMHIPVSRISHPRKGWGKSRIVPASYQPGTMSYQAQRAQWLNQLQLTALKFPVLFIAFQHFR